MAKLFIEDLDLKGRRVLMRVDFNVPVKDGRVENDKRLRASLPSIEYVLGRGASLVLMSHLGRPDGQKIAKYSLRPVAEKLAELLGRPVKFLEDCVGPDVEKACAALAPGEVALLENLRFHIEEEGKVKKEDGTSVKAAPEAVKAFRASLSRLGDVYVNDAFGTAHRAHSSTAGVVLPRRAAGYLMKKELDFLGDAVNNPKRPFVAIIGGAKVSGKIDVISALLPKVDKLIIGGGMAFTFYKAQGREIGGSLVEDDRVGMAKDLLAKAGDKLVLPVDTVVTDAFDFDARKVGALKTVAWDGIGPKDIGVDIGEGTRAKFALIVKGARTVVWNGPMGVF
ncbi:MAG TPA: phosphoglycerate kinase, partial [Vicinamibacteria bacterium]